MYECMNVRFCYILKCYIDEKCQWLDHTNEAVENG